MRYHTAGTNSPRPHHARGPTTLAATTALTDTRNTPTDEQRDDPTSNTGNYDQATVAIAIKGDSAHPVDDDRHEENGADNQATDTYERAAETTLRSINNSAQHLDETRDCSNPEENPPTAPLHYTQDDLDTTRNTYQNAAHHMTQPLAAN